LDPQPRGYSIGKSALVRSVADPAKIQLKACLITGATSGIGRATALALAGQGRQLLLTGRNEHAGQRVAAACRQRAQGSPALFIKADLASPREVRDLAQHVRGQVDSLDVLINNAGARFDGFETTPEGVERTFATNHLGHFLLTGLLLDLLLEAPSGRVVVTGSSAHQHVGAEGEWCLERRNWSKRVAYGKSKLANIVFAYELARRLPETRVTVNAADPGIPLTRFARNNGLMSWLKHVLYHLSRGELTSAATSGRLLAGLAVSETYAGKSGGYFSSLGEIPSSEASRDHDAASRLWNLSLKMTGLDENIGSAWRYLQPSA